METKKEILVRTYLVYIGLLVVCLMILGKVLMIQVGEGAYWRSMADSAHIRFEEIEAERGTIYSEDGQVLSTSVPEFDIYVDYMADGLVDRGGLLFKQYADSLALGLARLFRDKPASEYKKMLRQGFNRKERFSLLKRKISFTEYEALKNLPLVKLGKNKSGFIAIVRPKRLYPFQLLANRTIGIVRDSNKVGIEKKYDKYLSGQTGKRLVRYIAGGAGVPVEGTDEEPEDGCDVYTTLDVNMQDIAQEALTRMMVDNEALRGTCIIMEVKTGKIKAIANLGRQKDGSYWEDYNYAVAASEPGSTWKLVTLMSVLEDKRTTLESIVNLEGGKWKVAGQTVFDSEVHGMYEATVQQAFERSSNVGMAKLVYNNYYNQPSRFLEYLHRYRMDTLTGIDLPGESRPQIHKPGSRWWSNTTLPWMGFGYNLTITPMHTAMLYNAVANGGRMMKPYLVSEIRKDGAILKSFVPVALNERICSDAVLQQLKTCLEGVVERGTARSLKTAAYTMAGKTGTSLVADKGITYADHMYQSSFAGYFPATNPQFTIVVVIRNKAHAPKYYGGLVAGPVFREVADRLYAGHLYKAWAKSGLPDSSRVTSAGLAGTMKHVMGIMAMNAKDSMGNSVAGQLVTDEDYHKILRPVSMPARQMPSLSGFGLKDALEVCEERGLMVTITGKGKVSTQSIEAGRVVRKGQTVHLALN